MLILRNANRWRCLSWKHIVAFFFFSLIIYLFKLLLLLTILLLYFVPGLFTYLKLDCKVRFLLWEFTELVNAVSRSSLHNLIIKVGSNIKYFTFLFIDWVIWWFRMHFSQWGVWSQNDVYAKIGGALPCWMSALAAAERGPEPAQVCAELGDVAM